MELFMEPQVVEIRVPEIPINTYINGLGVLKCFEGDTAWFTHPHGDTGIPKHWLDAQVSEWFR